MTDNSSNHRWFVLVIVMLGTFMAILDSSIVNVALPHMMSTFGVNRNQIEWVATGFMLASAVAMPLVGWFVSRVGHKALYVAALAMFTLGSAACALSWSYNSLIVARVLQAVGGGAIQPVGMAIIADLFEPRERGRALGLWGTGIMIGPALGPTLGGYLTDWFSWRTIFSVNLPIGVITLLLAIAVMRSDSESARERRPFDWWGFLFLSMALIGGLLALSKGQEKGWDSGLIRTYMILSFIGTVMFISVEKSIAKPLLDLSLFRYRNYSLSMILALFRAVGLFGGVFLLPIFLESVVGYTTIQTGLWMMPGAVAVGAMMPVAGRLSDKYNPGWLVAIGAMLTAVSLILYGHLEPRSSGLMIIGPQLIRGVGLALMMAPLMTTAINAVPRDKVATASSFLNVAQRVGGSFGIAMLNTFVTDSVLRHSVHIGTALAPQSQRFQHFSGHTTAALAMQTHQSLASLSSLGSMIADRIISINATVLGFENGFVIGGFIVIAGIPLALMLKKDY